MNLVSKKMQFSSPSKKKVASICQKQLDHASIAGFQRVNIKVFPATYCNAAAASFVRHGSQEIPIFIIGCVVYLRAKIK